MIYFDNAATTLKKPETVAKAVFNAINSFANASRLIMLHSQAILQRH